MNHQDFINKYLGTFQREPGMKSAECVWASKLYANEVQGYTLPSFGGSAFTGWNGNTFSPKYWKRVNNSPTNFPKKGDHIFFGQGMGPNGHVAIVNTANVNSFTVIEQNHTGRTGDVPGDEMSLCTYKYTHVLGWFTPLINIPMEEFEVEKAKYGVCPELAPNQFKKIPNYHQVVNGHCTIFAAFTAIAYNLGMVFKNLRVQNTAKVWCNPTCTPEQAVKIICDEFKLKYAVLKGEEAQKALDLGYALVIAIVAPNELIADGMRDGVIDGKYSRDLSKSHALCKIVEGKIYLLNDLGKYIEKGYYNQYEISAEQLGVIMKGSNHYLIYG